MLPDTKIRKKQEIEMSLGKYPDAQIRDFSEFLEIGYIACIAAPFKKNSFLCSLMTFFLKFRHTGSCLSG